jgi:hypothetical protein
MQRHINHSKRNRRGASAIAPREEHDIARDREELAQLIGQMLARRWLRNQQGRSDAPQSSADAD